MTATITTAAPVLASLDGADTTGPDITAPNTADRLAATRQAHAAAVANADHARQRADRATAQHRKAGADHAALIARASSGEAVDQTDIRRARTAVSQAADAADHATLVARGAETIASKAHITALFAEADHLAAEHTEAIASRINAAGAVDAAWTILQAAIGAFNDTSLTVSLASTAVRLFNVGIDAHARSNAVLAAMNQADRPSAGRPADVALKPVRVCYIGDGFGEAVQITIPSLAGRERSLFGLLPPTTVNHPIPPRHPGATVNGMVPAGWKPSSPAEAEAAQRANDVWQRGGP